MSCKCTYAKEKAIVKCLKWQLQVWVWWASEQMVGWCAQLHLKQLAIFIFRGAIPGIIQSQVALAHTFVCDSF